MLPSPLPSVVFQRIDDGAVLFEPRTEVYFGLNEVGARIWALLPPASRTLADLCAKVAAEYPEVDEGTIRTDVVELLEQLRTEGLVSPPDAAEPDAATPR